MVNEFSSRWTRCTAATLLCAFGTLFPSTGRSEIPVRVEHNGSEDAGGQWSFPRVGPILKNDVAAKATFKALGGRPDPNGGDIRVLHDGLGATEEDQPRANFFFAPGVSAGRVLVDLGRAVEIDRVQTFSWHGGERGPQVYTLYGAAGQAEGFQAEPGIGVDPEKAGWARVARVDTRAGGEAGGGQYGVTVGDSATPVGHYRYLLLATEKTDPGSPFANTFWSEIDVVERGAPEEPRVATERPERSVQTFEAEGFTISVDTTGVPDLTEWARAKAGPMAAEWYPRLVRLLASEGPDAPRRVTIRFVEMRGVADTAGSRVRCAAPWFRENLNAEGLGAVFHELVHVVQQYHRARRLEAGAVRPPGWLVEGIADYYRWFLFQPDERGAEIPRERAARARFDASYRPSANFLDWATREHAPELVPKLNAAIREGRYRESMWRDMTGQDLSVLGERWKQWLETR